MRYARVTPSTATHSQSDIVRSCPPSKEFVIEYVSENISILSLCCFSSELELIHTYWQLQMKKLTAG